MFPSLFKTKLYFFALTFLFLTGSWHFATCAEPPVEAPAGPAPFTIKKWGCDFKVIPGYIQDQFNPAYGDSADNAAIVFGTGKALSRNRGGAEGGVECAVRKASGDAPWEACKRGRLSGEGEVGEVYCTAGGKLAPKILLAILPEKRPQNFGNLLRTIYSNALRIAIENGISRLAFAAIGLGQLGEAPGSGIKVAIMEIYYFINEYRRAHGDLCPFKEIRFVIYDPLKIGENLEALYRRAVETVFGERGLVGDVEPVCVVCFEEKEKVGLCGDIRHGCCVDCLRGMVRRPGELMCPVCRGRPSEVLNDWIAQTRVGQNVPLPKIQNDRGRELEQALAVQENPDDYKTWEGLREGVEQLRDKLDEIVFHKMQLKMQHLQNANVSIPSLANKARELGYRTILGFMNMADLDSLERFFPLKGNSQPPKTPQAEYPQAHPAPVQAAYAPVAAAAARPAGTGKEIISLKEQREYRVYLTKIEILHQRLSGVTVEDLQAVTNRLGLNDLFNFLTTFTIEEIVNAVRQYKSEGAPQAQYPQVQPAHVQVAHAPAAGAVVRPAGVESSEILAELSNRFSIIPGLSHQKLVVLTGLFSAHNIRTIAQLDNECLSRMINLEMLMKQYATDQISVNEIQRYIFGGQGAAQAAAPAQQPQAHPAPIHGAAPVAPAAAANPGLVDELVRRFPNASRGKLEALAGQSLTIEQLEREARFWGKDLNDFLFRLGFDVNEMVGLIVEHEANDVYKKYPNATEMLYSKLVARYPRQINVIYGKKTKLEMLAEQGMTIERLTREANFWNEDLYSFLFELEYFTYNRIVELIKKHEGNDGYGRNRDASWLVDEITKRYPKKANVTKLELLAKAGIKLEQLEREAEFQRMYLDTFLFGDFTVDQIINTIRTHEARGDYEQAPRAYPAAAPQVQQQLPVLQAPHAANIPQYPQTYPAQAQVPYAPAEAAATSSFDVLKKELQDREIKGLDLEKLRDLDARGITIDDLDRVCTSNVVDMESLLRAWNNDQILRKVKWKKFAAAAPQAEPSTFLSLLAGDTFQDPAALATPGGTFPDPTMPVQLPVGVFQQAVATYQQAVAQPIGQGSIFDALVYGPAEPQGGGDVNEALGAAVSAAPANTFRVRSNFVNDIVGCPDHEFRRAVENNNLGGIGVYIRFDEYGNLILTTPNGEFCCGRFNHYTVGELQKMHPQFRKPNEGSFIVIEGVGTRQDSWFRNLVDIAAIQADPQNNDSVVQCASNFNCLEIMDVNNEISVDLENLVYDRTQGPAAAISAALGLLLRRYFIFDSDGPLIERAQTDTKYLNLLSDVLRANPGFTVNQAGYVLFSQGLRLPNNDDYKRIRIGCHTNIQVSYGATFDNGQYHELCSNPHQRIHQVFAATVDFGKANAAYSNDATAREWARFFTHAAYDGVLRFAYAAGKQKVFLTLIGAGVFRNNVKDIAEALKDLMNFIRDSGLEVILIWYNSSSTSDAEQLRDWLKSIVHNIGGSSHYLQYKNESQEPEWLWGPGQLPLP